MAAGVHELVLFLYEAKRDGERHVDMYLVKKKWVCLFLYYFSPFFLFHLLDSTPGEFF